MASTTTTARETIRYGLEKYGARMRLYDVLQELSISESSFRSGMKSGRYPLPISRGSWPTEEIMAAALGIKTTGTFTHEDPFAFKEQRI